MNEQQLQEIKERVEKATQGQWSLNSYGDIIDYNNRYLAVSRNYSECDEVGIEWRYEHDAEFVCNAVNDAQALIAEVERLQELSQAQYKALEEIRALSNIFLTKIEYPDTIMQIFKVADDALGSEESE